LIANKVVDNQAEFLCLNLKRRRDGKKRGQNEGSIYVRKDGRIIGAVSIQGKRIEKSFKTKTEAREWLKQTISQIDSGLSFKGRNIQPVSISGLARIKEELHSYQYLQTIRTNSETTHQSCFGANKIAGIDTDYPSAVL